MAVYDENKRILYIRMVCRTSAKVSYKEVTCKADRVLLFRGHHKQVNRRNTLFDPSIEALALPKRSAYVIHARDLEWLENNRRTPEQIARTRRAAKLLETNNLKSKK